ncbi:MAG: hypothetical protein H6682_22990 [Candidatus Eisenbacteria bacterium]|nr:hypothetical protein [Candidatus Eisenbacteria bacterium]
MYRFMNPFLIPIAACVALAVTGCDDGKGPTKTTGGGGGTTRIQFREGTWLIQETVSDPSGCTGNESCQYTTYLSPDCGDGGGEIGDSGDDLCSVSTDGNTIIIHCELPWEYGNCSGSINMDGGGTFSDTSYDVTYTIATSQSGPVDECGAPESCEASIRLRGTWQNAAGSCGDSDSGCSYAARGSAQPDVRGAVQSAVHAAILDAVR